MSEPRAEQTWMPHAHGKQPALMARWPIDWFFKAMAGHPVGWGVCCAVLISLPQSQAAAVDSSAEAFIACASSRVSPLNDAADLSSLTAIAGNTSVVALGEPAHGASEPLEMRNRIIEYLVEHDGFTAVSLETSFAESAALHDFVVHGADESLARDLVREHLSWGFGRYAENVELIRWLRRYNANPERQRKVKFYGIDLSGADQHGSFSGARAGVDRALDLLVRVDATRAQVLRRHVEPLLEHFTERDYPRLSAPRAAALSRLLKLIEDQLRDQRQPLIEHVSDDAYEWAVHEVTVARMLLNYFKAAPRSAPDGEQLSTDGYLQEEVRDQGMADNVRWTLAREGSGGRVIVFAHNGHVMDAPLAGGIWSVYTRPPVTMGQRLRASLGARITIVGMLAPPIVDETARSPLLPGAVEEVMGRVSKPPFILALNQSDCSPQARQWLAARHSIRANFDTEIDLNPTPAFDAVVLLEHLTPAHAVGADSGP